MTRSDTSFRIRIQSAMSALEPWTEGVRHDAWSTRRVTGPALPFDPNFIARLMPALLEGAEVTVELALLTIAICLVWGLVVALAQATRGPLAGLAGGYV